MTTFIGPETVQASWLTEVAEQLDAAEIVTSSLQVTSEDMIVVEIPNVEDYAAAREIFASALRKAVWRGIVVRILLHRRLQELRPSGGDAA